MNSKSTKTGRYETPETELLEFRLEQSFLQTTFTAAGASGGYIDDLGETETDAGNAIWN